MPAAPGACVRSRPRDRGRAAESGAHHLERYRVSLAQPQLQDLIAMTPFAHRGHREKRERLFESDGLEVTMSFNLREFVREAR